MKFIALDVDGVLNNRGTHAIEKTPSGYTGIEDRFVKILRKIVDETGAEIVLSSDWKEDYAKQTRDGLYLADKLAAEGLSIVGITTDIDSYRRGEGIIDYLETLLNEGESVESFVVIDDNEFDFHELELTPGFVHTDSILGLTNANMLQAVYVLNNMHISFDRESRCVQWECNE